VSGLSDDVSISLEKIKKKGMSKMVKETSRTDDSEYDEVLGGVSRKKNTVSEDECEREENEDEDEETSHEEIKSRKNSKVNVFYLNLYGIKYKWIPKRKLVNKLIF
jgi:hypothetical protein